MKSKANKGVSRIDSGTTHGWFVRVYWNNKVYSKLFSDRKCGGKEKAYKLAKEYRNQLTEEVKATPKTHRKRRMDSRDFTGEVGVYRHAMTDTDGETHEYYSVIWKPRSGLQECTSFSISKFGKTGAYWRAVEHRCKMTGETLGGDFDRKPDGKKWSRIRDDG